MADEIERNPNDAVILNYSQNPVEYESIPKIWLTHPDSTEEDARLVPFTYGEAVSKKVAPDFSNGDMLVEIPEGELVTELTVKKPEELAPENIPEGMYIAGVGPGTFQGSGGTVESEPVIADPEWIEDICFWDYDGTLVHQLTVAEAASMTELPTPPSHDGLTFLGWNYSLDQVQVTKYPLDIGALYVPSDGKTHLHLSVTRSGYRAVPLNWSQTVSGGVSIDWGDGKAATTVSGTGVVKTTHTYSAIGEYDVIITVADGCVMTLGGGTSATTFVGSNSSYYRAYLTELYVGQNVTLGQYGVYSHENMRYITIPPTITTIPSYGLSYLQNARARIIPDSVVELGDYAVYGGNSSGDTIQIISIPESVQALGTRAVQSVYTALRIVIPKSITVLPSNTIIGFPKVRRVFMSDDVTEIGDYNFQNCWHLELLNLPASLTSIGDYCLSSCKSLEYISIPDGLLTIGQNFLYEANRLKTIRFPRSLTALGNYCLYSCYGLTDVFIPKELTSIGGSSLTHCTFRRLTFEGVCTFKPSLSSEYSLTEIVHLSDSITSQISGGEFCITYVPDNVYDTIVNSSISYKLRRLSEYPGKLPVYD